MTNDESLTAEQVLERLSALERAFEIGGRDWVAVLCPMLGLPRFDAPPPADVKLIASRPAHREPDLDGDRKLREWPEMVRKYLERRTETTLEDVLEHVGVTLLNRTQGDHSRIRPMVKACGFVRTVKGNGRGQLIVYVRQKA